MIRILAQATPPDRPPNVPIDLGPVAPELILVGTALLIMLLDALRPPRD